MADAQLDMVEALIARYAAGILPEPARILVEAHLSMQAGNRRQVDIYEAMAGDVLEMLDPVLLEDAAQTLKSVFAAPLIAEPQPEPLRLAAVTLPKAIRDLAGLELEDIPWKKKLPGFKEYSLGKIDGCDVGFFWIRPGRAVPAHTHAGYELSLILDGAFNDRRGRFAKGDISVADESIDHRPVAEDGRPCIGFAVSDAPLKLTGSLRQLIGDLIG